MENWIQVRGGVRGAERDGKGSMGGGRWRAARGGGGGKKPGHERERRKTCEEDIDEKEEQGEERRSLAPFIVFVGTAAQPAALDAVFTLSFTPIHARFLVSPSS